MPTPPFTSAIRLAWSERNGVAYRALGRVSRAGEHDPVALRKHARPRRRDSGNLRLMSPATSISDGRARKDLERRAVGPRVHRAVVLVCHERDHEVPVGRRDDLRGPSCTNRRRTKQSVDGYRRAGVWSTHRSWSRLSARTRCYGAAPTTHPHPGTRRS